MMYHVNDGSRVINQETTTNEQQPGTSTIYCHNNASIIQNTGLGKSFDSNHSMRKASVYSSTSNGGNGNGGNGGIGGSVSGHTSHHYFSSHSNDNRKSEHDKMTNDVIIANRRVTGATANVNEFNSKRNCRARRIYDTTTANGGAGSGGGGGGASDTGSTKSTGSTYGSTCSASSCSGSETSSTSGEPNLPYPGFPEYSLRYLAQDTRPRNWCLRLITNPWFERVSILVIIFNCITLGMYQPCVDDECVTNRCKILQVSVEKQLFFYHRSNTYYHHSFVRSDSQTSKKKKQNCKNSIIISPFRFTFCVISDFR